MLANFHTHSTFCDGKNTVEEVALAAIEKGFCAIGFSGHGYMSVSDYCMQDTEGYIAEVLRVKEKYKDRIQIYLGIEEESFQPVDRSRFDYIIGSSHKLFVNGRYYDVDHYYELLLECMKQYQNDPMLLAETYYREFCDYILRRKPDIVGHFDLITKFEESNEPLFFGNEDYYRLAERYMGEALKSGCVFEVNTGAISRGYRKTPYPDERLLHFMKKHDAKLILTSDSHSADTLDCNFAQTQRFLSDIGFTHLYTIYNNEWIKYEI